MAPCRRVMVRFTITSPNSSTSSDPNTNVPKSTNVRAAGVERFYRGAQPDYEEHVEYACTHYVADCDLGLFLYGGDYRSRERSGIELPMPTIVRPISASDMPSRRASPMLRRRAIVRRIRGAARLPTIHTAATQGFIRRVLSALGGLGFLHAVVGYGGGRFRACGYRFCGVRPGHLHGVAHEYYE